MFAGIPVAFLATALPLNLCLVYSHVLRSLTSGIWFVMVAHGFQTEISMNSSFQQGENVTSSDHGLGTGDWGLGTRDWRLEIGGCRLSAVRPDCIRTRKDAGKERAPYP
jgi:hypothetical protein